MPKSDNVDGLSGWATVVGALALMVGAMLLYGFVGTLLYTWFLLPLGAPRIGFAHVLGILCSLHVLWPHDTGRRIGDSRWVGIAETTIMFVVAAICYWCT